jgi:hypothetical protein
MPKLYKTQSADTTVEAELLQFGLWRQMSPLQKELLFKRVIRRSWIFALSEAKHYDPDHLNEQILQKRLGKKSAQQLIQCNRTKVIKMEDPIWMARKLASVFNALDIPYYVAGSVASSLQGEIRYTEDLDVVIQIQKDQADQLIQSLSDEFYISESAVNDAISQRSFSFNIVHFETTEKADLFVMRQDPFSRSKMSRRQVYSTVNLDTGETTEFYISTPEDTILQKLVWFRMTARESQKQWRDVLGVLKLQTERLDFAYMHDWAATLQLQPLLNQALIESGLESHLN